MVKLYLSVFLYVLYLHLWERWSQSPPNSVYLVFKDQWLILAWRERWVGEFLSILLFLIYEKNEGTAHAVRWGSSSRISG